MNDKVTHAATNYSQEEAIMRIIANMPCDRCQEHPGEDPVTRVQNGVPQVFCRAKNCQDTYDFERA